MNTPPTIPRGFGGRPGVQAIAISVLAFGMTVVCADDRPRQSGVVPQTDVVVEYDATLQETHYTIASDDCRISWTAYGTETNRGVVRHRSDCGLALGAQAELIRRVLRKVLESASEAAAFRTLSWGRLYPDGARDVSMAVRLAQAATRSPEWDAVRGAPRSGDVNGWVRKLANDALIYAELRPVFSDAGLDLRVASVEKVLVLPAGRLPFFERLRVEGAQEQDRVPFDCQTWFSVRPVRATGR